MKNISLLGLFSVMLLTACHFNKPVKVVKDTDQSTFSAQKVATRQVEVPANLPSNVTAICRDGSYSTATINICFGNGGIATTVRRYHSE